MTELIKLSASRLKTHSNCNRKYWYTYHSEIEEAKHPAALIGTIVHRTIEQTYRTLMTDGADTVVNPLMTYYEVMQEELQKHPDVEVEHKLRQDGATMVNNYSFARLPTHIEYEFKLPFPSLEEPLCIIHGFMDQVYDWGFIDMKTSKRKPNQLILDNDLQFVLYYWAYQQCFGKEPERSVWYHLRTGEELEARSLGARSKLHAATQAVTKLLEDNHRQDWVKNISESCAWCSYRQHCLG